MQGRKDIQIHRSPSGCPIQRFKRTDARIGILNGNISQQSAQTFIEPPLVDAFGIANTSNLSEEEFEMQEKRHDFIWLQKKAIEKAQKDGLAQGWTQGREEGRAEGREEGRAEGWAEGETEGIRKGKLDMARGMLRDGLPIEMIMKYSGLLKDEIEHLHTK